MFVFINIFISCRVLISIKIVFKFFLAEDIAAITPPEVASYTTTSYLFAFTNLINIEDVDCNVTVNTDKQELESTTNFWSLKPQLALDPNIAIATADFSTNLPLLDSNCKKTGDLITLDYEEVSWLGNPLASRVENVNHLI